MSYNYYGGPSAARKAAAIAAGIFVWLLGSVILGAFWTWAVDSNDVAVVLSFICGIGNGYLAFGLAMLIWDGGE